MFKGLRQARAYIKWAEEQDKRQKWWKCTCGANGSGYRTLDEAQQAADHHKRRWHGQ